jgi:hypothetical protein
MALSRVRMLGSMYRHKLQQADQKVVVVEIESTAHRYIDSDILEVLNYILVPDHPIPLFIPQIFSKRIKDIGRELSGANFIITAALVKIRGAPSSHDWVSYLNKFKGS